MDLVPGATYTDGRILKRGTGLPQLPTWTEGKRYRSRKVLTNQGEYGSLTTVLFTGGGISPESKTSGIAGIYP
jgi:hypothetical protein